MKFEFTTDIKNHSQIYVSKRHPTYLCCMSNEDIKKYIIDTYTKLTMELTLELLQYIKESYQL